MTLFCFAGPLKMGPGVLGEQTGSGGVLIGVLIGFSLLSVGRIHCIPDTRPLLDPVNPQLN